MSNESPTENSYQVYEMRSKDFGLNGHGQYLKDTHNVFSERKEAEEWIFNEGEKNVNYIILEVFRKVDVFK